MNSFRKKKDKKKLGPVTMIFILIGIIFCITSVLSFLGFEGQQPIINNAMLETTLVTMNNLFSKEGFQAIFSNITMNFQLFEPLIYVIISLIGTGIAYKSGLLKNIAFSLKKLKPIFLTFLILFVSIVSTFFGNYSFVFLMTIVAILYRYIGRNPIIGIMTVFLGLTLGMGAGIIYNYNDYSLGIMTQLAASIDVDKNYTYQLLSTLYISIFSTVILSILMANLIENRIVPKFKNNSQEDDNIIINKKASYFAYITFLLSILVVIFLIFPGFSFSGFLLDNTEEHYLAQLLGENSPFYQGLPYLFTIILILCSFVYGKLSGNLKTSNDFHEGLSSMFDKTGYLFIMMFFTSLLIGILDWTNFGTVFTAKLLEFMSILEFSGLPLIVVTFFIFLIITILTPTPVGNWLILSPLVVPLLMRANMTPEYTQFIFSATSGIGCALTPLFPYYAVLLGLCYKFQSENDDIITLFGPMKKMMPVILSIMGIWLLILVGWFLIGLPLGINSFPTL